ncbi:hypothetical protein [Salinisphaera sp. PC39]|uniref:hypothetical protein n=1 Tax=Salinisphaera sp. PC39 TaxID=1304156 RepID=UPI0033415356
MRTLICQILTLLVITGNLAWAADLDQGFATSASQQTSVTHLTNSQDFVCDTQESAVPEQTNFCYDLCCHGSVCCSALTPHIQNLAPTPIVAFNTTAATAYRTRAADAPPFPPNI